MRAPLPPLAATRAFEAAARHGSFTKAADELGMTQAAVSYQIKILEDRVGSPLFLRNARGVALTDAGGRFARKAGESLELLRDAFAEAKGEADDTLVISSTPTFATNFLAQSLGCFQIDHPSIAVRVEVTDALTDFASEDVDVAVRSGLERVWRGLTCDLLLPAVFTPMLSPKLAETIGGVHKPADLLKLPIIEPSDPSWTLWFAAAGLPDAKLRERAGPQFGAQVLEANAAIAGLGVGILTPAFYQDAVAQGQLCQPFDLACDDGQRYWLVYPENRRNASKIRAFRSWILGKVADLVSEGQEAIPGSPGT
ncbi:LysR substrate-binding domain-containing protein [Denitrobaculum tricleocarpae]|uniref:LysR family transcriptional regulator n=1 Tax=Denitrobaculum tricleocarpae TaxID=2591009 RepID=A0A545TXV2_9PROT|nr:LysR substrate-binding domain-containing protein [Denitrobaculum tricleocarpae]TQV82052.1 LysR family transcriptional regulator [Denitrobaculum tricleocarpae]